MSGPGTIRWIEAAVTRLTLPKVLLETGRRIVSFGRTEAGAILVVNDGQIVERGTHTELVARGGAYAAQWHVQTGGESASRV